MNKMEKEKQQIIDKIVEKANKELKGCKGLKGVAIAAWNHSVIAQTKRTADTIGLSRDVMLLIVFSSIWQELTSEAGEESSDKKQDHTKMKFEPPKGGFAQ